MTKAFDQYLAAQAATTEQSREQRIVGRYLIRQQQAGERLHQALELALKEEKHLQPGLSATFLRSHLQQALEALRDYEIAAEGEQALNDYTKGN